MSVVRRHPCEFCGHEFLLRLSGPEGVFGSSGACPSCGKAPTPPVPSGRTFPLPFKLEVAGQQLYEVEVSPEPLPMPKMEIFEMASLPPGQEITWVPPPMEVGIGIVNLGAVTRLQMYAGLGIPREFVEGTAEFSTTASSMKVFEKMMHRAHGETLRRITRPVDLDTEYAEGMTFREFWLKNFPRILALKLGPGPKRIRKKRLKKALGAAYAGHLMAGFIGSRMHEHSFAELVIPRAPVRVHETLVMEDGSRRVREFDLPGGGTAQDIGQAPAEDEGLFFSAEDLARGLGLPEGTEAWVMGHELSFDPDGPVRVERAFTYVARQSSSEEE